MGRWPIGGMRTSLLGSAGQAARTRARQHLRARWRRDFGVSITGMLPESAERPFEQVPAAPSSCQTHAVHLQEIAVVREIDALPFGVERRFRGLRTPKRRDRILQLGDAAVETSRGVGDIKSMRQPRQASLQLGKAVVVAADVEARHIAFEICRSASVLPCRDGTPR